MTIYCSFLASQDYTNMAVVTRWFDGLVNKDLDITNEIYSLREVDFDRQVSSPITQTYTFTVPRIVSIQ